MLQLLAKTGSAMNKALVAVTWLAVASAVTAVVWLVLEARDSKVSLLTNDDIDVTPTMVDHLREVGQWEFLSLRDEEIIDTVSTGFFSDSELVRIYYGTLSIGIDMARCEQGWITTEQDTVTVTLPQPYLLDYNFIDEASTKSFFETGKWTSQDRKALYERARRAMMARCLTPDNLKIASLNAKEQVRRTLQTLVPDKVVRVKVENEE